MEAFIKTKSDLTSFPIKKKVNTIQQIIQQTNKEIDEMVYEVYGLTAAAIKIVESAYRIRNS